MTTLKQTRAVLFVVLAIAGILSTGCGKSKNDNNPAPGISGGPVGYVPAPYSPSVNPVGGTGGCTTLTYNGSSAVLTFTGAIYSGTGLQANLALYNVGAATGGYAATYNRTNLFGDTINIYVSGSNAYAVVSLAPSTIAAIYYYNQGQVCGLYINASVIAGGTSGAGYTGNFGGGTVALTRNGQWVVTGSGQILQL